MLNKKKSLKKIDFLKIVDNKYLFYNEEKNYLKNDKNLIATLLEICSYTEKYESNELFPKYVIKKNYSFIQAGMKNQKHCDSLPSELLNKLSKSLKNSDAIKLIESFYNCFYTVVNIRSWIFYPITTKDHQNVKPHHDGFPHGILKIMFYKGNFNNIPALKIFSKDLEIDINGTNPIVIFEQNKILHSASAPILPRPTVEITLMPRGFNNYSVQQSGFMSGYPYNPFKNYMSDINTNLKS